MHKMKVLLVRHGETLWNHIGKVQGHSNSDLTENGINQAKRFTESDFVKNLRFADNAYTSDLGRAKQTVSVIQESLSFKHIIESPHLRENNHGGFKGKDRAVFLAAYKDWHSLSEEERWHATVADDESNIVALERVLYFLERVLASDCSSDDEQY